MRLGFGDDLCTLPRAHVRRAAGGVTADRLAEIQIGPNAAAAMAGPAGSLGGLMLEMRAGRPVWRATLDDGHEVDISAETGARLGSVDADEARKAAAEFGRIPVIALESLPRDQWTVAGKYDRHRPLWKATLAGPEERVLYVSSQTGAVVLDTDRRERFWNWLGSVPHWLYPTVLRRDNAAWRQVVMWVSGPCIVAAVTGLWIGILRVRLGHRRYKRGRATPYRGWMEWHHVAGLLGGVALIAWMFSGWLSVDPFRLFASGGIRPAARAAYVGAGTPPALDLPRLASAARGAKRVELAWFQHVPLLLVERAATAPDVLDASTQTPRRIDRVAIMRAAALLFPGTGSPRAALLTSHDSYWYGSVADRPLPVLRFEYADKARNRVYVDPATGAILADVDARRRLYRWLFDLLHKWDFNWLTDHRPAWDLFLWLLSIPGLVIAVSGVRIGWARLTGRRLSPIRHVVRAAS